ncbi:MAG: 16S rRNA (guanine(966)-N(2))-methyltransferase RsmD, partial [Defluviitaleaceae bacterium]|nr:16S rRNA (guanine(966)-N(2))-methyltransferase RsmD [Defluviitaleaceae bacterium]
RVIAGKARGTKLLPPKHEGIRPTSDYIKENLFNIIQNDVIDCNFLDIFCGSGAIGIEALSRGAKKAIFLDADKISLELTRQNLEKTKLQDKATIFQGDAAKILQKLSKKHFDIIFLDPPYFEELANKTLKAILELDILADMGYIIVETSKEAKNIDLSLLEVFKERTYGNTKLIFLRKVQNDSHLPR